MVDVVDPTGGSGDFGGIAPKWASRGWPFEGRSCLVERPPPTRTAVAAMTTATAAMASRPRRMRRPAGARWWPDPRCVAPYLRRVTAGLQGRIR
jgi:hypothetical protein